MTKMEYKFDLKLILDGYDFINQVMLSFLIIPTLRNRFAVNSWQWRRFQHNWPFVRRSHQPSVVSPYKCGALMFSQTEQAIEQAIEMPVIWDSQRLVPCHFNVTKSFFFHGFWLVSSCADNDPNYCSKKIAQTWQMMYVKLNHIKFP